MKTIDGGCLKRLRLEAKSQMTTIDTSERTKRRQRNREVNEEAKRGMIAKLSSAFVQSERGMVIVDTQGLMKNLLTVQRQKEINAFDGPPLKLISMKPYKLHSHPNKGCVLKRNSLSPGANSYPSKLREYNHQRLGIEYRYNRIKQLIAHKANLFPTKQPYMNTLKNKTQIKQRHLSHY